MSAESLPKRFTLRGEEHVDQQRVRTIPLHIVKRFLESFDSSGEQRYEVPKYVLEELARRFDRFMLRECNTLEEAFGGAVAQQRRALATEEAHYSILWDILKEWEASKKLTPFERSGTRPLAHAFQKVGKTHHMSPSNVERIWKDSRAR